MYYSLTVNRFLTKSFTKEFKTEAWNNKVYLSMFALNVHYVLLTYFSDGIFIIKINIGLTLICFAESNHLNIYELQ